MLVTCANQTTAVNWEAPSPWANVQADQRGQHCCAGALSGEYLILLISALESYVVRTF